MAKRPAELLMQGTTPNPPPGLSCGACGMPVLTMHPTMLRILQCFCLEARQWFLRGLCCGWTLPNEGWLACMCFLHVICAFFDDGPAACRVGEEVWSRLRV